MKNLPWMCILWPSFLAASALEMLVFAQIDPTELRWAQMQGGLSSQAIYSIAFFIFWLLALASSLLTACLIQSQPVGEKT